MSSRRAAQTLYPVGTVLTDSQTTDSSAANIGESTNVAIMVKASAAVTFTVQASDDTGVGGPGAGRNSLSASNDWYDYVRADSYETASGVEGNTAKIVFGGAGAVCIDLSPFAPKYLRITTADGNGVTAQAFVVVSE